MLSVIASTTSLKLARGTCVVDSNVTLFWMESLTAAGLSWISFLGYLCRSLPILSSKAN